MTFSPPRSQAAAQALDWPGLTTPGPAPVKAWLAERLFRGTVRGPRHWRERFVTGADRVSAAGFGPVFLRKWEFHLAYCEAGFRAGYLEVAQISFEKPGLSAGS